MHLAVAIRAATAVGYRCKTRGQRFSPIWRNRREFREPMAGSGRAIGAVLKVVDGGGDDSP